jgi:TonB family protein
MTFCPLTTKFSARGHRSARAAGVCLVLCFAGVTTAFGQLATAPRLRDGALPLPNLEAVGGGEVVLELAIDSDGRVARVDLVRSTPPYGDTLVRTVRDWRFEPATDQSLDRRVAVASRVLLAAVFRAPTLYAGPTTGVSPQVQGPPSEHLPQIESLVVPAYPPTAIGDASVLVEIELPAGSDPSAYRLLSPTSGFDDAALDAVRAWRFTFRRSTNTADPLFVYAVLGFRSPVVPAKP